MMSQMPVYFIYDGVLLNIGHYRLIVCQGISPTPNYIDLVSEKCREVCTSYVRRNIYVGRARGLIASARHPGTWGVM